MNLLEEFCNQIGLINHLEIEDINYTTDTSELNYVDGEEGDYGVIKYYSIDGDLIAVENIYGGDMEELEFTSYGKDLLKDKALNIFYNNVDNININK